MGSQPRILMGVIGRPHGVRGLVRVHSYAAVPSDLAAYGPLHDDRGGVWCIRWRGENIAELTDAQGRAISDREAAQSLVNRKLFVDRDRLPEPEEDEFYLADLVGLQAFERENGTERSVGTVAERSIGTVLAVHDYGAGASLEVGHVGRTVLIPFTRACVPDIDLAAGRLLVVRPEEIEVPGDGPGDMPGEPSGERSGGSPGAIIDDAQTHESRP